MTHVFGIVAAARVGAIVQARRVLKATWRNTNACPLIPSPSTAAPPCARAYHPCTFISQTKAELLHKQNAQIKELRRKHEAAQLAMAGAESAAYGEGDQEMLGVEEEEGARGMEADDDDKGGLVAALRKVCSPAPGQPKFGPAMSQTAQNH